MLAEVLGARLKEDPALAKELFDLLGGQEAVQQVVAERGSWIEDVKQAIEGAGSQAIRATDDSVIRAQSNRSSGNSLACALPAVTLRRKSSSTRTALDWVWWYSWLAAMNGCGIPGAYERRTVYSDHALHADHRRTELKRALGWHILRHESAAY